MTDASNVENGGMGRRISEVSDLLTTMNITAADAPRGFIDRLAEDNGWTTQYASRVNDEYRRFLLLAWISPQMVVPSKAVDEAWHLHLIHTRHYWDETCGRILQKRLHHDPGDGGDADAGRHERGYDDTLMLYRHVFGQDAPCDVWGCRHDAGEMVETQSTQEPAREAVLAMPAWTILVAIVIAMAIMLPARIASVAVPVTILLTMVFTYFCRVAEAEERDQRRNRERQMHRSQAPTLTKSPAYGHASTARRRATSESGMMDRTGDDGLAVAAILLATDTPAHASAHETGTHTTHASCSSHTSHSSCSSSTSSHSSCSSSSGSSCSSSSCGSSCGGGGCGGS